MHSVDAAVYCAHLHLPLSVNHSRCANHQQTRNLLHLRSQKFRRRPQSNCLLLLASACAFHHHHRIPLAVQLNNNHTQMLIPPHKRQPNHWLHYIHHRH